MGFDLLRLRPEICVRIDLHDDEVPESGLRLDEGEFQDSLLLELTRPAISEFWRTHPPQPFTPAAAAALALLEHAGPSRSAGTVAGGLRREPAEGRCRDQRSTVLFPRRRALAQGDARLGRPSGNHIPCARRRTCAEPAAAPKRPGGSRADRRRPHPRRGTWLGGAARRSARPFTHSILTIAAIVSVRRCLAPRRAADREMLDGVAFGLATHLLRDVTDGTAGAPHLWPLRRRSVRFSPALFSPRTGR